MFKDIENALSDALKKQNKNVSERYIHNKEILSILDDYIEKYPDIRFCQLLYNLGIISTSVDKFYEESVETLNNVKNKTKTEK